MHIENPSSRLDSPTCVHSENGVSHFSLVARTKASPYKKCATVATLEASAAVRPNQRLSSENVNPNRGTPWM